MSFETNITWLDNEIARLEKSPSREFIEENIENLTRELARMKARLAVHSQPNPEDAQAT